MEMHRIQKNEGSRMKLNKKFLLEAIGMASALTSAASAVTPQSSGTTQQIRYADEQIRKMVIQDEGLRTGTYRDTRGILTTGIGHNLENEKASMAAFNRAFGNQGASIRASLIGGGELTKEQAQKLFDVDYEEHRNRAAKLIPNLHEYDPEVQSVLVSGTYRGHVGDSPKFRRLLAAGKFEEASKELLDRDEYKYPERDKKGNIIAPGVLSRLERDSRIIGSSGSKQKQGAATTSQSSGTTSQSSGTTSNSVTTQEKPVTTQENGDYTIGEGDTIYSIARKHGKKPADIIAANPQIKDPNQIKPNQKLRIPK
jgi:LysM repeat protein/GH24 family phage-related lysozyme (muramidase)